MNPTIEKIQRELGIAVLQLTPNDWKLARADFMGITCYSVTQVSFISKNGERSYPGLHQKVKLPFADLRTEMAALHANGHAWYTATFTLTPDGKFKFDFDYDYDHLPAFDIMPSPDKWLDEFKHYPRPELQAQIQDWIDGKIGYDDAGHAEIIARLKQMVNR